MKKKIYLICDYNAKNQILRHKMNSTEEASFHNSVNIYFPENIKIPDNVSKCFLYGFSNNNTYATIYVTSKYVKS